MILGIDPGKKGGFGAIDDTGLYVSSFKMPEIRTELISVLKEYKELYPTVLTAIEQVQYRPNQRGVITTIENYGRILGYLEAIEIPYVIIPAVRWKKYFKLSSDKAEAINYANRLFSLKLGKTEDGVAEALLIARYEYELRREQ